MSTFVPGGVELVVELLEVSRFCPTFHSIEASVDIRDARLSCSAEYTIWDVEDR